MSRLGAYLPQDRLRAVLRGQTLPDRTVGAALFADISGFTHLTEVLLDASGARPGSEALSQQLGAVCTALIEAVERCGGTVVSFAGDAIICWFDDADGPAAPRALTCARALQQTMNAFEGALTLKVSLAVGPARRFVVGDPGVRHVDALAGATVERMARGEHLAAETEIVLDEAAVNALSGAQLSIREWRTDEETGARFAVVDEIGASDSPAPDQPTATPAIAMDSAALETAVAPFLPRAVFERETGAQGAFLTEFRPCVVAFVRFAGIDYEATGAQEQLDEFVREVQSITARHGGLDPDLVMGDKGSYIHLNFGALDAHEDDARRAIKTAIELNAAAERLGYLEPLQIGITQGTLWVGAYGGPTRQTFSALGEEPNHAARLMMAAAPGEVLVSGHVHQSASDTFNFRPGSPIPLKGMATPFPAFSLTGARQERAVRLQEPRYALPMVGRQAELETIQERLELARAGQEQVIGIVGDAGMGKSRLLAEVIGRARALGFTGYGGACQSDETSTPYLAWRPIWQALFDVDLGAPVRRQARHLESELEDLAPERVSALQMLGKMLQIELQDNDFTRNLEPKYRQSALYALLEDSLRSAAAEEPLLIVLEDMHWVDPLSRDLLVALARGLAKSRVCFCLAYRPEHVPGEEPPGWEALPQFSKVELAELSRAEAEDAIVAKLAQLYPLSRAAVPTQLVDSVFSRAQGNPFYIEELLNFLRDRGVNPADPDVAIDDELPDSLHTLILSRLDQLNERERVSLRVASIIGRLFRMSWLIGYYPELGPYHGAKQDLERLAALDLTSLDTPEPELAYLFKHIVTHEVTYSTLPYATRAELHEQLARYLEAQVASGALAESAVLETLTHHYEQSTNSGKQREFLRKAADAAEGQYANAAALQFYGRLLLLLDDPSAQCEIHLKRGRVYERTGAADAEADYRAALSLAEQMQAKEAKADAQYALGKMYRLRGEFEAALDWLAKADAGYRDIDNSTGQTLTLTEMGVVHLRQGDYAPARARTESALELARAMDDRERIAQTLNNLGLVVFNQRDYAAARDLLEESQALWDEAGHKWGMAAAAGNLGNLSYVEGNYPEAYRQYHESLVAMREIGERWVMGQVLNNLAMAVYHQGDYGQARELADESVATRRDLGDKWGLALSLNTLGSIAFAQGEISAAQQHIDESIAVSREIGDKWELANSLNVQGLFLIGMGDLEAARAPLEQSLATFVEIEDRQGQSAAHLGLGLWGLAKAPDSPETRRHIQESLQIRRELDEKHMIATSLVASAGLAFHSGDAARATQILGAVAALLRNLRAALEPEVQSLEAETREAAGAKLGEEAFQQAWASGETWSVDVAVEAALAD